MEESGVVKGASDYTLVVIWITMVTVKSEIRPFTQQIMSGF